MLYQILILMLTAAIVAYFFYGKSKKDFFRRVDVKHDVGKENLRKELHYNQLLKKTISTNDTIEEEIELMPDQDYRYATDPPKRQIILSVTEEHGDAVYGTLKQYDPDVYLGRVGFGAVLKLLDRKVYLSKHGLPILKVKVLENKYSSEIGRYCWVGLEATNAVELYDSESMNLKI